MHLLFGLGRGSKAFIRAFLRLIYPPFCAHCHVQLEKEELLCPACFSQVELKQNRLFAQEVSIFVRTPATLSIVRQFETLQGARLVKGAAGYVALQLTELDALYSSFYVQKGFEDLGREIEKLTKKKFLGRLKLRGNGMPYSDVLVADPKRLDPKIKMFAEKMGSHLIYLVEGDEDKAESSSIAR